MLFDSRIIKKEVSKYSRGKDKKGFNYRININKADKLKGTVYIMNEEVFIEYKNKYEEIEKQPQITTTPTTTDIAPNIDLTTDIIKGINTIFEELNSIKASETNALVEVATLSERNNQINNNLKATTDKLDKTNKELNIATEELNNLKQQHKKLKNISLWGFITGKHKKFLK